MQVTSIVSGDVCLQTRPELIKLSRNVNRLLSRRISKRINEIEFSNRKNNEDRNYRLLRIYDLLIAHFRVVFLLCFNEASPIGLYHG